MEKKREPAKVSLSAWGHPLPVLHETISGWKAANERAKELRAQGYYVSLTALSRMLRRR